MHKTIFTGERVKNMKKKKSIVPPSKNNKTHNPKMTYEQRLNELKKIEYLKEFSKGAYLPSYLDHVPLGACMAFNKSADIQKLFKDHISECKYCSKTVKIMLG